MASPAQLAARAKFAAMIRAKKGSGKTVSSTPASSSKVDKTEARFPDNQFPPKGQPVSQPSQPMPSSPMGGITAPSNFGQVMMNNPMNPNMKVPSHTTTPHANNPKIKHHGK